MLQQLDTREKREEWIHRRARDLTGMPHPSWKFALNELLWSLLCFKGKGCFNVWIQTSLIKSLCLLFEEQYMELGLAA